MIYQRGSALPPPYGSAQGAEEGLLGQFVKQKKGPQLEMDPGLISGQSIFIESV